MPIYDYICTTCDHRADILHGINDPGPKFCPSCGAEGTMRKLFSAPSIHFKGSGWAKKDRGGSNSTRAAAKSSSSSSESSSSESSGGRGESSSSESSGGRGESSSSESSGGRSEQSTPSTPSDSKD